MVIRRALRIGGWLTIAVGVLCVPTDKHGRALASPADDLAAARTALAEGDVTTARAAYRKITSGPLWTERLVDTIRWNLLSGHPNEAWRVCELARRLDLDAAEEGGTQRDGDSLADLAYYRVLSEAKASVCTLREPVARRSWRLLLEAFLYRYPNRFQPRPYRAAPYDDAGYGPLTQHLDDEQTHYLAELPTAALIAGTGCKFFSGRFVDRTTAAAYELAALRAWYELMQQPGPQDAPLPGHEAVELRLLTLADKDKDRVLVDQLLARFVGFTAADWLRLPEKERRFVWQRLVKAALFPPPPYGDKDVHGSLVQQIILGLATPEAAEWMGLLNYKALPARARETLVAHLLTIDQVPEKPYLLTQTMHFAYNHGDMPAALAVVRRLLILDEAEDDPAVRNDAALLAALIFTEYRYDESMLGAVQNTLPSADWGKIFRRQLMVHALTGNAKGFALLLKSAETTQQGRALRLDEQELGLLRALAERQSAAFQHRLQVQNREARLSGRSVTFFADLGGEVLQLSASERQAVDSYLQAVAALLTAKAGRGGPGQQKTLELIRLYSGQKLTAYGEGGETVREGTVQVGVADLSRDEIVPYPYTWTPPAQLPLHELIVQPKSVATRDWEIR